MSSEKFESLNEEFQSVWESIQWKVDGQLARLTGEERKKAIRDVERQLDDARALVEDMETELMRAPQPYRSHMSSRIRAYNDDIGKSVLKLSKLQHGGDAGFAARRELLGEPSSFTNDPVADSQRTRLMQTGAVLSRTSDRIIRTQQIAVETEQIGTEIIDELGTQRDALVRTKERLVDTDMNLSRSRKIMNNMYRKVLTNKIILILIIIMELAILGAAVYLKFFKK